MTTNLGYLAVGRRANRLKDLSKTKPDNGIFPGIQHYPPPSPTRAPVSLPYFDHGSLLESIYTAQKPLLSASPEDLRMNLGFRQGNRIEPLAAKNGMSGVGSFDPQTWLAEVQQWPSDRSSGLNYGEIQTINAWLRDYGVPSMDETTARNSKGNTARDAVNKIWVAWQNLTLPNRDQMQNAMRMHLTAYGFDTARGQSAYWGGFNIGWPLVRTGAAHTKDKLNAIGQDAWLRYVAAMAIGRDLFAEEYAQVGGTQAGLYDTVAETQLEGQAVSGEWQNLAGVWRWKGYDLLNRPLNLSQPLFAAPQVPPSEVDASRARNTQFFLKFFTYPSVAAAVGPTLTSRVPALLGAYRNVIAPRSNAQPIADVPRTVQGYAALYAALLNVVGLDIKKLLGPAYEQAMGILNNAPTEPASPGICPAVYQPVVGRDGKTYPNACAAEQAGQLAAVTPQTIAGTGGVGNLLPSGPWQETALKIAKGAEAVLEGSVNKAKEAEAAVPNPAAPASVNYAPVQQYGTQERNNAVLIAAALGALLLL
jgi:hypothetical protein